MFGLFFVPLTGHEGITLSDTTLEAILGASNGDMRKAVTFLQSSHQLSGGQSTIPPETVIDISGQVPAHVLDHLWATMSNNSFDALRTVVTDIMYEGYALAAILSQLHDALIGKPSAVLADVDKALICEKIAEVDMNLVEGASEALQLLDLTAFIMRRLNASVAEVDSLTSSTH